MPRTNDNWERLVAAVIKKQQLWELFHAHSRSPSVLSDASDFSSISALEQGDVSFIYSIPGGSSPYNYMQQAPVNESKNWNIYHLVQNGIDFEQKPVPPPLPNKCDWEIDPTELDFSSSAFIGKGASGEIIKANWRGTPVAVKRILPNLSDNRLIIIDFRREVNLLAKLRHPNIVQFLGAVTDKKPLMLITEYLRGGDLHQYLKRKGALDLSTAVNFALDIARGLTYLHSEPNVVIHRDLKPRNVLLVNQSADRLKVGDFGLSKLITVQHSRDVYKLTGETGSYRYMAPELFKHRKYDKKVDVFSFAMILYEMLEGEPPLAHYGPYEAAKYVSEGHRPNCKAKGFIPELKELVVQCWAADMNQRPSFLDILKKLEKIKDTLPSEHHWNIFTS